MESENESRTNGLVLQGDNPNLKQEEAALLEWASNFLLSDDSDNVNYSDHNPYNRPPSPPPNSPPPPPSPPPPLSSPQRSHSLRMPTNDKPRLRWTQELHKRFLECVDQLGGPFNATPKNITRKMNVDGLTILHVKSHLQKYRATMLLQSNELAHTPLPFQHDQSIPYETPAVQSTALGTMMLSSQMPMQDSVQRSLQIQGGAQEKYLNSLKKRAYEFCTPQVTPRASFKHQKFDNFTQVPLPNPSCIITEQSHMHSHEHEQQRSLEFEKEAQDQYLIQKGYNNSRPQTTEEASLKSSKCENFSQAPFPTLPCITAEQTEMQSHSQQVTNLLPSMEEYNLSSENAEVQTVLPSGSPLHNNQHGLCSITDWFPGSPLSGLWPGVEHYSFNEMDPISFSMMPGGF